MFFFRITQEKVLTFFTLLSNSSCVFSINVRVIIIELVKLESLSPSHDCAWTRTLENPLQIREGNLKLTHSNLQYEGLFCSMPSFVFHDRSSFPHKSSRTISNWLDY
jgi:hypothetical protein